MPGVPGNLSPHQGQATCGSVIGTTSPVLQAQYVDADGSNTLTATFNWQQLPSGAVTSVAGPAKPANNNGSVTLNLGAGAEGKSYRFQVRTWDGNDYSPWSPWCSFTVDTTVPPPPLIEWAVSGTAPQYHSCDTGNVNDCVPAGGPGIAGAFKFSQAPGPAGQDVIRYVYGWDSPGSDQYSVAPGAATPPILYTPPHYGINRLTAYSVDGTGHSSPTASYYILVDSPSAAQAYWPLDDIDGHNFNDQISPSSLTTTNVPMTADARYIGQTAATFNGATSEATQLVPSFDTSGSFSISAWVRLAPTTCTSNQTIVSIDSSTVPASNHASGFFLQYDCVNHRWRMSVPDKNVAAPALTEAVSANNSAVVGRWTHLVGVFQEDPGRVRLWVNGTSVQATAPTMAFMVSRAGGTKATGPVVLGRDRWNDANSSRFGGEIADVRLWNRVIVADDINGTNDTSAINGVPAQPGLLTPRQVGGWPMSGCDCPESPDWAPSASPRPVSLVPNPYLDPSWDHQTTDNLPAWFDFDGNDQDGALRLDGVSGYVSTANQVDTLDTSDDIQRPVLRTDQSVTVSAWAKLTANSNVDQIVVNSGPLRLISRGSDHKWGATMSAPNGSGGWIFAEAKSDVVATTSVWVHLVGVFDAGAGQVRLYVNGVLQTVVGTGAVGVTSPNSLMIGAMTGGFYFGGSIDDVRVYQGILNAREITNLST